MSNIDIIKKIDGFKKDTQKMSKDEKLHYGVGYFKDCKEINELLRYIADYDDGMDYLRDCERTGY